MFRSFVLALTLLATPLFAAFARADVEVVMGRPFGVGRISVPLSAADANAAQVMPRLVLKDAENRIFYPAIETGRLREIVGGLLGSADNGLPGTATAFFLFKGDEPLTITFYTPTAHTVVATPRQPRPRQFDRLQDRWWREYQTGASARQTAGEIPPTLDAYLTTMLSTRLGLPLTAPRGAALEVSLPQKTFDLIAGVEKLRAETVRETLLGRNLGDDPATQPLPPGIDWASRTSQPPRGGVVVEPLAMHVPLECFYIRFNKFSDYLWLDNLTEDYGGDLANMLALRGQDLDLGGRMQTQLALEKNVLADLFGDALIADVALIGQDIYTHEGAAVGMLFHAKNTKLLGNDFTKNRAAILKREAERGATLQTVKVAERDVTLLSTPDNRLRSYYAVDGDFHLVTTSRAIIERFFQAGAGKGALGGSEEFQRAREQMPLTRNDTVFVYFSSAVFENLVGPQYQVQLGRRLQTVTDRELLVLSRLAAKAEGQPNVTTEDLVAGGFLPRGFGKRTGEGVKAPGPDAREILTPIPDVTIKSITRREGERLNQLAAYRKSQWPSMDPLMVGIRRFKLDDKGRERLLIDANAPLIDENKYGWLTSMLGPPVKQRVLPVEGDVVHLQAYLNGSPLDQNAPPHHMFLGLRDHLPLAEMPSTSGMLKMLRVLRTTPGYLGAYPRPGTLDQLPLGLGGRPDQFGFAQMPLIGLWRRTVGPWSALSFDPQILGEVTERFAVEETDNPAQVRLHATDLSTSKAAAWVNALFYERARQTSVANAAFLQHVSQQLYVSPAEALPMVENLVGGKLVCVLGGKYNTAALNKDVALWQSDAWPGVSDRAPDGYQSPLLTWFRGLDADLTKVDGRIALRAQLDMQRKEPERKLELPSFNLPNIFKDFGKPSPKPKPEKLPEPELLPAPKPPAGTSRPREL